MGVSMLKVYCLEVFRPSRKISTFFGGVASDTEAEVSLSKAIWTWFLLHLHVHVLNPAASQVKKNYARSFPLRCMLWRNGKGVQNQNDCFCLTSIWTSGMLSDQMPIHTQRLLISGYYRERTEHGEYSKYFSRESKSLLVNRTKSKNFLTKTTQVI